MVIGGGAMTEFESVHVISDPLSTTDALDEQSGSWSISGGELTLLGEGGNVPRNPDGVGDLFHSTSVSGMAVDARVDVKLDPSPVSSDFFISAGIGFGPASEPDVRLADWHPWLGLSAGAALCIKNPSSDPGDFSLMNIHHMKKSPDSSGSTIRDVATGSGFHELRVLASLGWFHVWLDGDWLTSSRTHLLGDLSRVHLWGQSNHASTPHVFWRNLRVKTFPLGITPLEEP